MTQKNLPQHAQVSVASQFVKSNKSENEDIDSFNEIFTF